MIIYSSTFLSKKTFTRILCTHFERVISFEEYSEAYSFNLSCKENGFLK